MHMKSFWNNLKYGEKGAYIGFLLPLMGYFLLFWADVFEAFPKYYCFHGFSSGDPCGLIEKIYNTFGGGFLLQIMLSLPVVLLFFIFSSLCGFLVDKFKKSSEASKLTPKS